MRSTAILFCILLIATNPSAAAIFSQGMPTIITRELGETSVESDGAESELYINSRRKKDKNDDPTRNFYQSQKGNSDYDNFHFGVDLPYYEKYNNNFRVAQNNEYNEHQQNTYSYDNNKWNSEQSESKREYINKLQINKEDQIQLLWKNRAEQDLYETKDHEASQNVRQNQRMQLGIDDDYRIDKSRHNRGNSRKRTRNRNFQVKNKEFYNLNRYGDEYSMRWLNKWNFFLLVYLKSANAKLFEKGSENIQKFWKLHPVKQHQILVKNTRKQGDRNEMTPMDRFKKLIRRLKAIDTDNTDNSFGVEKVFLKKFDEELVEACAAVKQKTRWRGIVLGLGVYVPFLLYVSATVYGTTLVAYESVPYKDVLLVNEALMYGAYMLGQSLVYAPSFNSAKACGSRILALIRREPKIKTENGAKDKKDWVATGAFSVKDVEFSYPTRPSQPVLREVDLSMEAGKTVALVGSSGCGKSTILQLIQRYYDPDTGHITAWGVIRHLFQTSMRSPPTEVTTPNTVTVTTPKNVTETTSATTANHETIFLKDVGLPLSWVAHISRKPRVTQHLMNLAANTYELEPGNVILFFNTSKYKDADQDSAPF